MSGAASAFFAMRILPSKNGAIPTLQPPFQILKDALAIADVVMPVLDHDIEPVALSVACERAGGKRKETQA
jgi:hypothetical protein